MRWRKTLIVASLVCAAVAIGFGVYQARGVFWHQGFHAALAVFFIVYAVFPYAWFVGLSFVVWYHRRNELAVNFLQALFVMTHPGLVLALLAIVAFNVQAGWDLAIDLLWRILAYTVAVGQVAFIFVLSSLLWAINRHLWDLTSGSKFGTVSAALVAGLIYLVVFAARKIEPLL